MMGEEIAMWALHKKIYKLGAMLMIHMEIQQMFALMLKCLSLNQDIIGPDLHVLHNVL